MLVAMGVDTDHDVHGICQHPFYLRLEGQVRCRSGARFVGDTTVMSHARRWADRLLIKPTDGCQPGTAPHLRTDRFKDTHLEPGSASVRVTQTKQRHQPGSGSRHEPRRHGLSQRLWAQHAVHEPLVAILGVALQHGS